MSTEVNREVLTQEIIDLFVSIIGFIPRDAVSARTCFITEFDIIDDDLTCFMMQVKWQYKLSPTPAQWESVSTIDGVVDLVLTHR